MSAKSLPEAVRILLLRYVDSIEILEVLLFLTANPSRAFSADQIAAELRINPVSVAHRIRKLLGKYVQEDSAGGMSTYQVAVTDAGSMAALAELSAAYKVNRFGMYEMIYSPLKRINALADAFVLKPHPDGDKNG